MKAQIANRLGIAHVRDTLAQFASGSISREQAMESLQISRSRLYELRTSFLAARASGHAGEWLPGVSGGNHMPDWPDEVHRFLRKVLHPYSGAKRYSYSFAACEVGRKFHLSIDRGQVRHWAMGHGLQAEPLKPRLRPMSEDGSGSPSGSSGSWMRPPTGFSEGTDRCFRCWT